MDAGRRDAGIARWTHLDSLIVFGIVRRGIDVHKVDGALALVTALQHVHLAHAERATSICSACCRNILVSKTKRR